MIPTRNATSKPCNGDNRYPCITHYRGGHPLPPEAIPRQTACADVASYLAECEARRGRGWSPHYPATIGQGLAAYRAGLITYRPAEGEPERSAYDAIDAERDQAAEDDAAYSRLLSMLVDSPDRRAALRGAMREGGRHDR